MCVVMATTKIAPGNCLRFGDASMLYSGSKSAPIRHLKSPLMSNLKVRITGAMGAIGLYCDCYLVKHGFHFFIYHWCFITSLVRDLTNQVDLTQLNILLFPSLASAIWQFQVQSIGGLGILMPPPHAQANPFLAWKVNAVGMTNSMELESASSFPEESCKAAMATMPADD